MITAIFRTIEAHEETLEINIPGVFPYGDCLTGPRLMSEAIAARRHAAGSIHDYVTTGKIPPIEDLRREMMPPSLVDSQVNVTPMSLAAQKTVIPVEEPIGTFVEVEGIISRRISFGSPPLLPTSRTSSRSLRMRGFRPDSHIAEHRSRNFSLKANYVVIWRPWSRSRKKDRGCMQASSS